MGLRSQKVKNICFGFNIAQAAHLVSRLCYYSILNQRNEPSTVKKQWK